MNRALAGKRDAIKKDDKGFTLIELLVVVLIIGILAAIAIPVFLGQQNQAKDAAAQSDLGNAKIALISYQTANPDDHTDPTAAALKDFGYTPTKAALVAEVKLGTAGKFCIQERSEAGDFFAIDESDGAQKGSCTDAGVFTDQQPATE